ncbi:BTAD domain-containing putative transcriptional regulator [Nonomuraea typhae]|uniref:BTAD domain-containing putative transcriptional regulator n=1 Tax=Nonomuraea typhae TaxID=2603600 RepID=UPI001CA576A4|nr:BTAD domain-containing putative transcriptional regulator [Nonomuraea typhae]
MDVSRFRRRLRDGEVTAALAEWGGDPLAGLDAPGLAAAVAGLTEEWLGAVEAGLGRRDPQEVVGTLAELTERHPLREGLWALLMTALYRAGRQGDALAAFRRAREHLVTELGVEPGPELRELESQILAHDVRQRPPVIRLLGRDDDLRAVADALRRCPIVTLVGPGGIGKTQLALAAAAGYDGEARRTTR